jgi:hypothetical protein
MAATFLPLAGAALLVDCAGVALPDAEALLAALPVAVAAFTVAPAAFFVVEGVPVTDAAPFPVAIALVAAADETNTEAAAELAPVFPVAEAEATELATAEEAGAAPAVPATGFPSAVTVN